MKLFSGVLTGIFRVGLRYARIAQCRETLDVFVRSWSSLAQSTASRTYLIDGQRHFLQKLSASNASYIEPSRWLHR